MSQESRERLEKCLDVALSNRQLEIELLWKRNTAFWLFVAAIAAGVGVALKQHPPLLAMALSVAGALTSLVWFLVNLSGKKWQTSWEIKAEHYLRALHRVDNFFIRWLESSRHPCRQPVRYSVSGLLAAISLYVTFLWIGVAVYLMRDSVQCVLPPLREVFAHPIGLLVLFTVIYFLGAAFLCQRPERYFIVLHDKEICLECSKLRGV